MKPQFYLDIIRAKTYDGLSVEVIDDFSPYMTQRFLSMKCELTTQYMNISTNTMWDTLDNDMYMKLFSSMSPTNWYGKYVKADNTKRNKTQKKYEDIIDFLANRMEISKREILEYIEQGMIDVKQIKKEINI